MSKKPNIIFFFTDQQRYDSIGLNGNPLDLTPNFDRIARQGTHLPHLFSCQPVCGPARASLQTGLYASQTGCFENGIPLSPDFKTLAHYFNEAGYHTSYIGKWHLGERNEKGPVRKELQGGYQEWLAANALEHVSDAYDTCLYDGEGQEHRLPGYRVDALTDAAIRYVARDHEKPYFLFFSLIEPHHQNHRDNYPAPDGYEQRYTGRWTPPDLATLPGTGHQHLGGYWGMVKRIDEAFGRLMDALKSTGQLENTILLFTSDHGSHFKTRNAEYKRACHDSCLRVPGLITGPGFERGGEVMDLVSLVDLPPTLLDAAGIPVPEHMAGTPLLPYLHRKTDQWQDDVFAELSESQTGRCVRTKRWTYSVCADEHAHQPASETYREDCLYDNASDPYQLCNLIGLETYQAIRDEMRERLLKHIEKTEGVRPEILPAEVERSGQRHPILPRDQK